MFRFEIETDCEMSVKNKKEIKGGGNKWKEVARRAVYLEDERLEAD